MAQSYGSDHTLSKSDKEAPPCEWSEEQDRIPLKQRLKILLARNSVLDFGTQEIGTVSLAPIDINVKKEAQQCYSQGFRSACFVGEGIVERLSREQSHAGGEEECNMQEIEENSICSTPITILEVNDGIVIPEEAGACENTSLQQPALSQYPIKVKAVCTDEDLVNSSGDCLNTTLLEDILCLKVKSEIHDDFLDDLDHIVLKERQRMLLSRKSLELIKHVEEGNYSGMSSAVVENMIQHNTRLENEESRSVGKESSIKGNHSWDIPEGNASILCKTLETGSSNCTIAGSSRTNPQHPSLASHFQGTKSESFGNHQTDNIVLSSVSSTFVNVKVERLDYELQSPGQKSAGNSCFADISSVKSEHEIAELKLDHMLLRERINLIASRDVPDSDVYGKFECSGKFLPSVMNCRSIESESVKPPIVKRSRKRRKTATDSVETALEEDAPGLLQVLIDKGVLVDEIKLYGERESSDVLDDSLSEDSFADLEAVISKLFSQRHSLLKFDPIRCTKGEKASYCLACLISLVDQARYLQFRKWPIEWGWCRDLQSFIFVFERHNRIVLERPEYGYATYFFEWMDSLPTDWQIKRLVTAMKLTSCSRISLIENRTLMVGEDLTENEARVLKEYGWRPNSGLGTMLNYRDRVVHDRKNEKYSSEWRSKIGKLLMDGYNGGTIVSTDIPKKVMEYNVSQSPQIKLEL